MNQSKPDYFWIFYEISEQRDFLKFIKKQKSFKQKNELINLLQNPWENQKEFEKLYTSEEIKKLYSSFIGSVVKSFITQNEFNIISKEKLFFEFVWRQFLFIEKKLKEKFLKLLENPSKNINELSNLYDKNEEIRIIYAKYLDLDKLRFKQSITPWKNLFAEIRIQNTEYLQRILNKDHPRYDDLNKLLDLRKKIQEIKNINELKYYNTSRLFLERVYNKWFHKDFNQEKFDNWRSFLIFYDKLENITFKLNDIFDLKNLDNKNFNTIWNNIKFQNYIQNNLYKEEDTIQYIVSDMLRVCNDMEISSILMQNNLFSHKNNWSVTKNSLSLRDILSLTDIEIFQEIENDSENIIMKIMEKWLLDPNEYSDDILSKIKDELRKILFS